MMKKNVLLLFLASATMVGCSSDTPTPEGDALIRLRSTTLDASLVSRSPVTGSPSTDIPFTALVPCAKTSGSKSLGYVDGIHAVGAMTFRNGDATTYDLASLGDDAETKSTFPSCKEVYMFGLYPNVSNLWTLTNSDASATFSGSDDLMAAAELSVKQPEGDSKSCPMLTFGHLLTRLEVKLKAKDAAAIASVGAIKSIRLVADAQGKGKVRDQVVFTPSTGQAAFAESATKTEFPFYKATSVDGSTSYSNDPYSAQSYTLTTSAALQAYSMVASVEAGAATPNEYYLAIERGESGNVDYVGFDLLQSDNVTPFEGNTAGYYFSVVITYSQKFIESVEAVVGGAIGSQDWKDSDKTIDTTSK